MADLIAPPSMVNNVPMTKDQAQLVQREKQKDNETRKALEALYGASRLNRKTVQLTRRKGAPSSAGQGKQKGRNGGDTSGSWVCPQCHKTSNDIRHVCAFCLTPEPAYLNHVRAQRNNNKNKRAQKEEGGNIEEGEKNVLYAHQVLNYDSGARICTIAHTKRNYRLINEPVIATPPQQVTHKKGNAAAAHAHRGEEENDEQEEEEEEGESGMEEGEPAAGHIVPDNGKGHVALTVNTNAVYQDEPSCRPPGHKKGAQALHKEGEGDEGDQHKKSKVERRRPATDLAPSRYTHFLSIPVGKTADSGQHPNTVQQDCAQLLKEMRSFMMEQSARTETKEADSQSKQKAPRMTADLVEEHTGRLHITLLLLTLPTKEDVQFAKELLTEVFAARWAHEKPRLARKNTTDNTKEEVGLQIALQRVHVMPSREQQEKFYAAQSKNKMQTGHANAPVVYPDGNAAKASVVFMGVKDESSLSAIHRLQSLLRETYQELLQTPPTVGSADPASTAATATSPPPPPPPQRDEQDLVHMTLLNKKWHKENKHRNQTFDATALLEKFKDRGLNVSHNNNNNNSDAQPFVVDTIELCRMRQDHGPMYEVEAAVSL